MEGYLGLRNWVNDKFIYIGLYIVKGLYNEEDLCLENFGGLFHIIKISIF